MAQSPNSLANLRPPFKPGQSGNPKGAVKKDIKREDWQEFAAESGGVDKNGKDLPSRERLVMLATFKCATDLRRKDCTTAQKTFFERVQGRVPDKIQVSGEIATTVNPLTALLEGMIARKKQEEIRGENEDDGTEGAAPAPPEE